MCTFCHKCFRANVHLRIHLAKYHGEAPVELNHTCHVCGKSFVRKGDLTKHLKIHSDLRPFVCDICQKSFARSDKLKQHINSHQGLKPHVCTVCNKAFTQKVHLKGHLRIHVSANSYSKSIVFTYFNINTLIFFLYISLIDWWKTIQMRDMREIIYNIQESERSFKIPSNWYSNC